MAEFSLPANSKVGKGKTYKAPAGATKKRAFNIYRWNPDDGANPRMDSSVTNDISVAATFVVNTYNLAYAAGTNGTLSGSLIQTVNYGDSLSLFRIELLQEIF